MGGDALLALRPLISDQYKFTEGYVSFVRKKGINGNMKLITQKIIQTLTCSGCGGTCLHFFEVENGDLQPYTDGAGSNGWYGPGVHCRWGIGWKLGEPGSLKDVGKPLINGTEGFVNIEKGTVGLLVKNGEPIILAHGNHYWADPDVKFIKQINLGESSTIALGPYTLVTVDEGFAAITSDNGQQVILRGGTANMLNHRNWQFKALLSMKLNTETVGPMRLTSGDNIPLNVAVVLTWQVTDAKLAAERNVDLATLHPGADVLTQMRVDVHAQVKSSMAALVGRIFYGASGKEADNKGEMRANTDPNRLTRKALYDQVNLRAVVDNANHFIQQYGATVMSLNVQTAECEDARLAEILTKGAQASFRAEEVAKNATADARAQLTQAKAAEAQARAARKEQLVNAEAQEQTVTIKAQGDLARAQTEAEAVIVKAKAMAEAATIRANALAEAIKLKAEGQKMAGIALQESATAVALEKLKIAYAPFTGKTTRSFFFGIDGPGDLPKALMGERLAEEVGMMK